MQFRSKVRNEGYRLFFVLDGRNVTVHVTVHGSCDGEECDGACMVHGSCDGDLLLTACCSFVADRKGMYITYFLWL